MKSDNNVFNKAIPAALIPFVAPFAAIAAEGTGRVKFHFYFHLFGGLLKYQLRRSELTMDV